MPLRACARRDRADRERRVRRLGCPQRPEIIPVDRYPLTVNYPDATKRVAEAFGSYFGHDRAEELSAPVPASEDFGSFGAEWHAPSVFWYVGGTDPDTYVVKSLL